MIAKSTPTSLCEKTPHECLADAAISSSEITELFPIAREDKGYK